MQRVVHPNGVVTYQFELLRGLPVDAHVSTRHGGVSPEPWNTLNFSIARGDLPERVQANRVRLAQALGLDVNRFVRCQQVHGTGVAKVDGDDAGVAQESADGSMTDTLELPLALVFADCVPVLLYDQRNHALGVCHAGWRGTVNGMVSSLLWAMQAAYNTNGADVIGCIGPSIGPGSYEVGEEVVAMATAKLIQAERYFHYPNGRDANPHFDLWQANAAQLLAGGVPEAQIGVSGIDTAENTGDFFSHRAEKGQCGLFSMTAWLRA